MRRTSRIQLTDPDLHAWLLGAEVSQDLAGLGVGVAALMGTGRLDESWWTQRHAGCPMPGSGIRQTLGDIYRTAPLRLAERLHEGLNVFWAVGQRALPPLLGLINPMVQAELNLYTKLDQSGKPYREHVVHVTRVAALAHLFLCRPQEMLIPSRLHWERLRMHWGHSREFQLLRHFAVEQGWEIPDPSQAEDPWGPWVKVAVLLAGLIHDLGYLHKALGEVAEKAAQAVRWVSFTPTVDVPDLPVCSPLAGLYKEVFEATKHGQVYASLPEFLRRQYRDLHSVIGALWLAQLSEEMSPGIERRRNGCDDECRAASMAELSFQLASLMAFAHDLSLSDKARRKQLGMRQVRGPNGERRDVVNLLDYPLSTLFSLADVLQEFGRPIQVVVGNDLRFWVPVAGIEIRRDAGRSRRNIHYLTKNPTSKSRNSLLPREALEERSRGAWAEEYVGNGVSGWLESAALDDLFVVREGTRPADCRERLKRYYDRLTPGFGQRKLVFCGS